jgi:hypothetical protein
LLNQIPAAGGTRTDVEPHTGAHTKLTRTQAAADAGVSKYQKDTALRVANVPAEFFEAAIESESAQETE